MRARMDAESEKRNLNFSLIATPAEGLSGRFVKIDRERFGVIPGVTDRDYYTNSFHIPVYFDINAFDKIRLEAPYHALTNGGHITYVELDGDPLQNVDAFEQLIRCMKESGHRLRLDQSSGRPRPSLRLYRHYWRRVPTLPPQRNGRSANRAYPPHHRLSGRFARAF